MFGASRGYEQVFARTQGRRPHTLVVSPNKLEAAIQSALEEDLSVMALILEKEAQREQGQNPRDLAMGIVITSPMDTPTSQALYLDGYGALFTLNVRFPLLPPAVKKTEPKSKKPEDSDWEKARRELFEPRGGATGDRLAMPGMASLGDWNGRGGGPEMEYDAGKVESLKRAILETLKNAGNIRHLKPEEAITVRVASNTGNFHSYRKWSADNGGAGSASISFGGPGAGGVGSSVSVTTTTTAGSPDQPGGNPDAVVTKDLRTGLQVHRVAGARGGPGTVVVQDIRTSDESARPAALTIRVKKIDVDNYSKGKMSLEEFQKKATISVY